MKNYKNNNDTNKVLKSGTFAGFMHFFQLGLRYANSIVATRLFGAENFGIYVLTRSIAEFVSIFSGLGLHQGLLRHIPHYKIQNDEEKTDQIITYSFKVSLIASVFLGTLLFLASDLIATKIFNNDTLSNTIKVISFLVPVLTIIKLVYSYLRGVKKIKQRVLLEKILFPTLLIINIVVFYLIFDNYYGLIIGFIVTNFETMLIGFFTSKLRFHFNRKASEKTLKKEIVNYSWPLLLSSSLDYLQKYMDTLMLGVLSTTISVGVYTVALRISAFIAVPLISFNMLFSPLIAEIYSKKDLVRLDSIYKNITKATLTIALPIVGVILLIPDLLLSVFGKEFGNAALALIIISLGQLVNVSVGASGQMLIMTGNQRINLINSIIFLIVTITLNSLLIPKYGVFGAGLANCVSLSSLNVIRVIQIKKIIKIMPFTISFLKPITAFLISISIVFVCNYFFTHKLVIELFSVFMFIFIYILLLWLIGFDAYEKELMRDIKVKLINYL